MDDQLRYEKAKTTSIINIFGNILLTIIKAVVGITAGSTALLADAFHSVSDLIATLVLLKGLKIAHTPADESHPYGHHRAETITSKILSIILVITAFGIGYEAWKIFGRPVITPPSIMAVYVALLSIIIKEGMYQYTVRVGRNINSSAIITDAWHHRSDALSSIAALIGISGAILGYPIMDPIAGMFVAILILKTGVITYIKAVSDLMDTAPPKELLEEIRKAAASAEGVDTVQDIRVRQYGSKLFIDMKICVDQSITVEQGHGAAARAKENVFNKINNVQDVLIHVNPCDKSHDDPKNEE